MTKADIIQKLLENKNITAEEAVILLQEQPLIQPVMQNLGQPHLVPKHQLCGCGVCNCVNGNEMVDVNKYETKIFTQTTTTLDNFTSEAETALNEMNKNTE